MVPSRPSLMMRSRARTRWGVLRRCMPTCTTRLYFRAAASIAWPSTTSTLIGFCTHTSIPDFTASIIGSVVEHPAVDVAQRDHVDWCHLNQTEHVSFSVPAGPDQADTFLNACELF